jgi:hypothetical protein
MQYLVTEELINPGPLLPPDQLVGIMRRWILPSMDALINQNDTGPYEGLGGGPWEYPTNVPRRKPAPRASPPTSA